MEEVKTNTSQSCNKRIARNSIFMSIRMVVVLVISLFTTRAVLSALGIEDYGIYNLICGFVAMFSFLNSSMASATQRFYNFELGKNGSEGVRNVYKVSLIIHLILALIIVAITEAVGLWFINTKLVIPADRIIAAQWIFHFSVFSLFLNIVNVPYVAVIMAYERMDFYAYVGIIDAVLKLLIVGALYLFDTDKLIFYGFLYLLIVIFDFTAYRLYAKHNFKELQMVGKPSKQMFIEILSFAGWNVFGAFAYMMREQGINLLLNTFFGPILNAAKGVANQVNGALQGFAGNLLVPARPQIIQSYAKGEYDRSFSLMNSISKLSCIIFLMMSLPVCLLIHPILSLWLGDKVPEHSEWFIIIMLVTNTWGSLVSPVSTVVHATGKMKFYQTLSSLSNLMSVPLAYFFLVLDDVPEFAFIALFITMLTNHLAGLVSLQRLTSFSILKYLREVVVPLLIVIVLSVITTIIPHFYMCNMIMDFIVVICLSTLSILFYSYLICFNQSEKEMIKVMVNKLFKR